MCGALQPRCAHRASQQGRHGLLSLSRRRRARAQLRARGDALSSANTPRTSTHSQSSERSAVILFSYRRPPPRSLLGRMGGSSSKEPAPAPAPAPEKPQKKAGAANDAPRFGWEEKNYGGAFQAKPIQRQVTQADELTMWRLEARSLRLIEMVCAGFDPDLSSPAPPLEGSQCFTDRMSVLPATV